jgi:EmrB/QacA subfamily drug resistance transporter
MADAMTNGTSKLVTLIIASTSAFVFPFMMASVNVALPTIGREFAMEAVMLGWVATSFILASATLQVPIGRFADIWGRKKIFTYGLVIQIVTNIFCATASSGTWLILARVVQGFGGAMTFSTLVAILTSVSPPGERGRAIGVYLSAVYLGLALGPFLGGVLTQHFGWRSIFFLTALLGLLVLVLVLWKLKGEWAEARGEKYDTAGAITFCLSLGVLMYGFSVLPTMLGIVLVILGLLGLTGFFWWETRIESPVLNVNLFRRNTVFVFSNLAALINYSATFAVTFYLSLYLQYMKGMSPQTAGLMLIVQPVVMTILTPISGRLADRVEPRLVAAVGMALSCVGLSLLAFLTDETALLFIIASLVILGFGFGFFASPNTSAIMGSVENRVLGVASGTVGTMRSTGMMLSMGVAMILFSIYIGQAQITPEYYPAFLTSMKTGFIIFAALCFVGIFAQLAGRNR